MKKKCILFMGLFLCLSGFVWSQNSNQPIALKHSESEVKPQAKYALICLKNRTRRTLTFKLKWGDDRSWRTRTIEPEKVYRTWFEYEGDGFRSPTCEIKFDSNPGSVTNIKHHRLERYRSPDRDCDHAKKYIFKMIDTKGDNLYGSYIKLVSVN